MTEQYLVNVVGQQRRCHLHGGLILTIPTWKRPSQYSSGCIGQSLNEDIFCVRHAGIGGSHVLNNPHEQGNQSYSLRTRLSEETTHLKTESAHFAFQTRTSRHLLATSTTLLHLQNHQNQFPASLRSKSPTTTIVVAGR